MAGAGSKPSGDLDEFADIADASGTPDVRKIKLLQKTRNEPGMLLKTKDRC